MTAWISTDRDGRKRTDLTNICLEYERPIVSRPVSQRGTRACSNKRAFAGPDTLIDNPVEIDIAPERARSGSANAK